MSVNLPEIQTEAAGQMLPGAPRFDSRSRSRRPAFRSIVLVERRDEVFDRLAAGLAEAGLQVERATCSAGALRRLAGSPADLLVANVDLPAGQQDYLSAPIDLSRVKEGDLTAAVKLANLPLQDRPGITFAQAVVVSKAKPQVVLAALDQHDQAGIASQQVCPVTGADLKSMGGPVKVLVGGHPLYLCCKGCLGKVRNAPETYLRTAEQ